MKLLRIAVVPLLLAPLLALVPAGPASAGPQDPLGLTAYVSGALDAAGVGAPVMSFGIASVTDGIKVCFDGTATVAGPWTAHIAGARVTTNASQVPISYDHVNPGSLSIHECPVIPKYGSLAGEFEMTFEYLGGTSGTTVQRAASLHGVAWWQSGQQDAWVATSGG